MGVCPTALYLCLDSDLRDALPGGGEQIGPEASHRHVAASALRRSFLKKFKDNVSENADAAALEKFLSANQASKEWRLTEQLDTRLAFLRDAFKSTFRDCCDNIMRFGGLSLFDVLNEGRTGPGASLGVRGNDFYTKVASSTLTTTSPDLYEWYSDYCSKYRIWNEAEAIRSSFYDNYSVVSGSRLSFVPKSYDISRVICVEPSLNMFYQLGFGALIEKEIKRSFGISFDLQPDKNKRLARIGSRTGSFCTIDLESASDRISMQMLTWCASKGFHAFIKRMRSPRIQLPDGNLLEAEMVSNMGNGFTFPLQTLIFCCAVSAVFDLYTVKLKRPRGQNLGNFGVFGDDIIVPNYMFGALTSLLGFLGFKVNTEKSFSEGHFRESCGGDYFRGRDVRGVYLKTLKTPQDLVTAVNLLNRWSAKTGLYLPRTVRYLLRRAGKNIPRVPLYENDNAGLKVPSSLVSKLKLDPDCQSTMYFRWETIPSKMRFVDGAVKGPKKYKGKIYSPPGIILALLRGDLRNHSISIRLGAARYGRRKAISPNWDWLPNHERKLYGGSRLENAIRANVS